MNLADYRKAAGISQVRLAQLLTDAGFTATQGLVSQWEKGAVVISAERARQLEQVTRGGITRAQLRPDLYSDMPPADLVSAEEPGVEQKAEAA